MANATIRFSDNVVIKLEFEEGEDEVGAVVGQYLVKDGRNTFVYDIALKTHGDEESHGETE